MPLASTFALQWYGPGMAGAVVDVCSPTSELTLKGIGRMSVANTTTPTASPGLVATRTMSLTNTSVPTSSLGMKGVGKMSLTGKVNELGADDVTGAVLEAKVEGNYTLKEAIRLMLAVAVGKTDIDTSGPNPIVKFRDANDIKDRVTATMTGSERTSVTKNVT